MPPNDRLSALEARLEAKSESRDDELGEIRDAVIRLTETERSNAGVLGTLGIRLGNIENRPTPGVAALWGPALSTAIAVGSLGGFVIGQIAGPINEKINVIREELKLLERDMDKALTVQASNTQHLVDIDRRVDVHLQNIQELNKAELESSHERGVAEGKEEALQSQLNAVDNMGSRRWNHKDDNGR